MFEELAHDNTSGATALTRSAAEILSEALINSTAGDPGEFWNELQAACRELTTAQREMAPLINLAGKALSIAERLVLSGVGAETLKRAVPMELSSFIDEMDDGIESLVREGASALPACSTVATLSASECVMALLRGARSTGRTLSVTAAESRPAMEGVAQAERLRALGIPVDVVADDALPGMIAGVDLVLVGADRVSQEEFVGKAGVRAAARAAADAGVPFLAAATEERLISAALAPKRLEGTSGGDSLFEAVPLTLITGVITGDGLMTPEQTAARISKKPVPPSLLRVLFDRTPPSGL